MKKIAVFGLDLEDWYHLDYVDKYYNTNVNISLLDGFDEYINIFEDNNIKSTIFTVGEIAHILKKKIIWCSNNGFEIASHTFTHRRPLTISKNEFVEEIISSKDTIENIISKKIIGFRAPCFSLNRAYLDILFNNGYLYDSSKINFKHPLYGHLDISDFEQVETNIYKKNNFMEFEIPILNDLFGNIPFSGGGYLRLLPLIKIKSILKKIDKNPFPLFFYIHPFELSSKSIPNIGLSLKNKFRFEIGRKSLKNKINYIIKFLKEKNWEITTFENLYERYSKE
jgi:polysaccharide deacetylase family protein (PEP-CTERM system associated)